MNDSQFADLILAEKQSREALALDPMNALKFKTWNEAWREYRKALNDRQMTQYAKAYPPVQFDREPDEHLLDQ